MFGDVATLGSGLVGDPASDLIRAAAEVGAVYNGVDGGQVDITRICAGAAAPRPSVATRAHNFGKGLGAGSGSGSGRSGGTDASSINSVARISPANVTVEEKLAEIESFVRKCAAQDEDRQLKKQRAERQAAAKFAPPRTYD